MTAPAPIPALIVSGFLGSGKTTLVGHLLRQAQATGTRLAIISNEFGDTGIDRALLDAGAEGLVELDGGCVCCRLSDALSQTVELVLTRARPDRLVLETSGVALPGEVVIQFWRPPIEALVSDVAVVVLVDGDRLLRESELDATFVEQLEAADKVLLNKVDLLDDAEVRAATARLVELTAGRPVQACVYAEVSGDGLFPGGAPTPREPREARPHTHERFGTSELDFPGVVDPDMVLARVRAQDAIRAKGFVRTPDGVRVVQGVGPRVELSEPRATVPAELVGRVVVIRRLPGEDHHG